MGNAPADDLQTEPFVRALVHAARNRMQRSQTALSFLRVEAAGQAPVLELVDELERHGDALAGLLDAARAFVAPLSPACAPTDLDALLESARRAVLDDTVALRRPDGPLPAASVDDGLMREAFQALLRNAADAGADTVEAHWRRDLDGAGLAIDIRDNGAGFSDAAREHAFEPFWSGRRRQLGLGLARVARVVAAHGGEVGLVDDTSSGAAVRLRLPHVAP